MSFKMLIRSIIILIIVAPAYQICERKLLGHDHKINVYGQYYKYSVYQIGCYGNSWEFDCNDGENYLVIKSHNVSIIDKSLFKINCIIMNLSMTNGVIAKIIPAAFSKFEYLKYIDLSENNISSILDGTFANDNMVQVLNISRNKIENIDEHTLYGLNDLQQLILHHNQLKQFNFSYLKDKNLTKLDLAYNNITRIINNIESDNFTVEYLDLSYNQIRNLSKDLFPNPQYLKYLNLSGNGIEEIPLKTFFDCHNILSLNLSDNQLYNLQFGLFNNLNKLQILDLSNNKLITNDLHTTFGLKALKQFYFHDNDISEFNINMLPAHLTDVSFFGNKFQFTCRQLSEIVSNLDKKGIRMLNGKQYEKDNFDGIECSKNDSVLTIDTSLVNSSNRINFEQIEFIKSINTFNERINYLIKVNEKSAEGFKKIDKVNKNLQDIFQLIKEQNMRFKNDAINDYFETKFKETNFYKFFKNFKAIEINALNQSNSVNNNTAVMERLISSYMAPEEDSVLKSISVQFTIILILIIGFLLLVAILRRNWIINQFRFRDSTISSNLDRINLTMTTTPSSMESLEIRNA